MNNMVKVTNQKYRLLRMAVFIFLVFTALPLFVLFTFRALDTQNYNGRVKEVTGYVLSVYENDDGIEIMLHNSRKYSANRIRACYPEFGLYSLKDEKVTLYLPETQVGSDTLPWIIGIKQGNETLIDYNEVIACGKAEAKVAMIVSGVIAGVFGALSIGVFAWLKRTAPVKEEMLYKAYCEFAALRQPSCPLYRFFPIALLIYVAVSVFLVAVPIALVGAIAEKVSTQIFVVIAACVVFVASTVGLFVFAHKLVQKERDFYLRRFPFDLDDISHVTAFGRYKKQKEKIQQEMRAERKEFPHRYYDGGNNYLVNFSEVGVELVDEKENFSTPDTDFVFGDGEEKAVVHPLCTISYEQLNFEALPYFRKKDHPLTVVIKSRIENKFALPEEMVNDLHILLDSNLLATLKHFNVEVENLQYVLDNKSKLMDENCKGRKKQK